MLISTSKIGHGHQEAQQLGLRSTKTVDAASAVVDPMVGSFGMH